MDPDKAVLLSAVVTAGSTIGASVLPENYGGKGQLPSPRLLIGTGLAFTGISIVADIAPSIGVPLAACMAITAFLWYGIPIMDSFSHAN